MPIRPSLLRPRCLPLLLLLLALLAGESAAQWRETDRLSGRVVDPAGRPVAGAIVTASSARGVRRVDRSDEQGRFSLVFAAGDGPYALRAVRVRMAAERTVEVPDQGDGVVEVEIRMRDTPVVLDGLTVVGEEAVWESGGLQRELDADLLAMLPLDRSVLAPIAALEPGVLGLEASDSIGSGGFSVFGQRPDLNHVSVDGATFGSPRGAAQGGLGLPPEAVRLTRVITNSYDVSRGQFSGGQISATTRGGTNRPQGTLTYNLFEPRLQWDAGGAPMAGGYAEHRFGGSYGGPIRKDRVFYFLSGSARRRMQDFASLVQADAAALQQLGAHPDSVGRFLAILEDHGLSPSDPVPVGGQLIEELLLFGRLDFTLSKRNSLTLRGDGRVNYRDGTRVASLGLPHSGGNDAASGGGIFVGLTTQLSKNLTNDVRAYLSRADSDAEPYFPVPEGRVRVGSVLPDGTRSVANLVFGGNRSLPVTSNARTLEISDELVWKVGPAHQVKLGALFNATRSANEFSATQFGAFTFNSLEDFANSRAASFSRSLTTSTRAGGGENLALHLGDVWQTTSRLQLTYGLRLESSLFALTPAYNPRVDSAFARRTDRFPSEVDLSPRLGFTYTLPPAKKGAPTPLTLRGGVGVFRGRPPFSLYSTAMDATGLAGAQLQISCVGAAVPTPDWSLFQADAATIPDRCETGQTATSPSGRAPNVTVFTPDFQAPRSWRASVQADRPLSRRLGLSVSGTYNLGTDLYGVRDLNLAAEPRFHLPHESGRPVFVGPDEIVQRSGQIGLLASRVRPEFGQVLELYSTLRSRTTQLTATLSGNYPARLNFRAAYTWSASQDQSSFSCCSASQGFSSPTTGGDPNQAEWARSSYERRHSLLFNLGATVRPWLELTMVGRTASGAPFTPIVSSDLNGDGARNDRAFLFDPDTAPDPAVAAGMQRLLESAPDRVRRCIGRNLGGVAARNSCRANGTSSLELRANLRPTLPGTMAKRLTTSIASQNLLMGLDQLVSGPGRLRGWGQSVSPDATLLYTRGWDPERRLFRYEVNERFGDARQGQFVIGSPFQLHLEARVTVGPSASKGKS